MTRAIVVAMHKYTPFGDEFYEPILDFFLQSVEKYRDEFDRVYIVDSTWNVKMPETSAENKDWVTVIKVDPNLRYYDAYKEVLPQIEEQLVLFMDNDMVVYREGTFDRAYDLLELQRDDSDGEYDYLCDVVSIYDTIGTYVTKKMNGKNKFCPYWFAAQKDLLMVYKDVYWGSDMPRHETLGALTKALLDDDIKPYEWEEDKSNCLFDGTQDGDMGKDLGYYHIRAGSTVAYLLATRKYGDIKTYNEYLKNQPKQELLRHCAWYAYMGGLISPIVEDLNIEVTDWLDYYERFLEYHGL